jgi:hypothetical protein
MKREEAIKQLSEALAVLVPELKETEQEKRDEGFDNNDAEYHPQMIDLGLPSGRLWADRNVGAKSPEDDGLYFSWGNTVGYAADEEHDFSEEEYNNTPGSELKECIVQTSSDDAATENTSLEIPAFMPRMADFAELVDFCDHEWVEQNGVKGMRFTSRGNGNSIFFPASGIRHGAGVYGRGSYGYSWSSSLNSQAYGYSLYFNSGGVGPASSNSRFYGFSVRAVQ